MSNQIVPDGYCHCGCGAKTKLVTHTNQQRGVVKGQPNKYLHGHHNRGPDADKASFRDGFQRKCKECGEWKNKETDFYEKSGYLCKSCRNAQIAKQRRDSGTDKEHKWWVRYRLRLSDYEAMFERQGGHCALCERSESLVVDHDHQTGAVRGLLCYRCNRQLVAVEEGLWLERALAYVKGGGMHNAE